MKIFKAGKYPQGIFTKNDLKKMITDLKSVPGILGHTSGWKALKVPAQAIPIAGEFSNFRVVGDYIEADSSLTEFGKKFVKGNAIKNVSVEISTDGKLAKVGMLGAVPPQIKDLDSLTSLEFNEEDYTDDYIKIEFLEFEEVEMKLEEIVQKASLEEKLEALKLIAKSITSDQKSAFRAIAYEFAEPSLEDVREFAKKHNLETTEIKVETQEELEKRLRNEIASENKVKEFCEKAKTKIIPAFHNELEKIAKELVKNSQEIEFSENNKGSLFGALEKIILEQKDILSDKKDLEFSENNADDIVERAKKQFKVGG